MLGLCKAVQFKVCLRHRSRRRTRHSVVRLARRPRGPREPRSADATAAALGCRAMPRCPGRPSMHAGQTARRPVAKDERRRHPTTKGLGGTAHYVTPDPPIRHSEVGCPGSPPVLRAACISKIKWLEYTLLKLAIAFFQPFRDAVGIACRWRTRRTGPTAQLSFGNP